MIANSEILSYDNVPTKVAAKYLDISYAALTIGLREKEFPFGCAIRHGKAYTYQISPGLLAAYKNGTLNLTYNVTINST